MSRPALTLALTSLLTCTTLLAAPPALRSIQQLDTNWRFSQSDPAEAQSPTFNDTTWSTVTLPHDWSIDASIAGPVAATNPSGPGGGYFPTGIAWYRHTLTLAKLDPTKIEERLSQVQIGIASKEHGSGVLFLSERTACRAAHYS